MKNIFFKLLSLSIAIEIIYLYINFPWNFLIKDKLNLMGDSIILKEYDDWLKSHNDYQKGVTDIPINNLPNSLQDLYVKKATLKPIGIYLLYKKSFFTSYYIIIRNKESIPIRFTDHGEPCYKRIWFARQNGPIDY